MKGIVKIIPIKGYILSEGTSPPDILLALALRDQKATLSDEIIKYLRNLKEEEKVKAVIFEINSLGGRPEPSKEISKAIKNFGKVTIAQVQEYGASGAYQIASACDKIVASPSGRVGGIGVEAIVILIGIEAFPPEKIKNIKPFSVEGIAKEMEKRRESIQRQLKTGHQDFLEEIKNNRNIKDHSALDEIASGKVYSGEKAIELGLVDYLGNGKKAIEIASELTGSQLEPEYAQYEEKRKTLLEISYQQLKP